VLRIFRIVLFGCRETVPSTREDALGSTESQRTDTVLGSGLILI